MVVDRLTKYAHFIPVKSTYSAEDYVRMSIDEIVVAMVFRYPSYRIGVHNSHPDFGGHFKKGRVLR